VHPAQAKWVTVPIPSACRTYLASLVPSTTLPATGPTLPATGADNGLIATLAAAMIALGLGVIVLRRRTAI